MTYYTASEFDKAQWSLNQVITIAKERKDKKLLAKSYNLLGAIQFNLGNYSEAIKQYNYKLEIVRSLQDTISIIETYYNISLINNAEGSYLKSLENNYTALGLSEKIKDSVSMMIVYEGLGISYSKINDSKNAIVYLKKALQNAIMLSKSYEEAGIMVDLGTVYQQMGEQEKALYYFKRGEEIAKKNGDKLVESIAISGRGVSLMMNHEYKQAIEIFNSANTIHANISYRKGIAENQLHIANCNIMLGNYKEARRDALNSLTEGKSIGEKKLESDAYKALSTVYEKLNKPDSAYACFKKHITISDTLNSRSMLRKTSEFEANHENQKLAEERALEEKIVKADIQKQKQIRNTILIAVAVVFLLLLFSYRNYKQKQKANTEIVEKKKIIEHKNKDILDSINYSKRLQDAVLMTKQEVKTILPQSFIVYLPKEIVSGDFYFIEKDANNNIHVALADSTKHGVPGAFMSIAGYNILKQALKEKSLSGPHQILQFLHKELKSFLRNSQISGANEGINISYCIINLKGDTVHFAGAGHRVWISSTSKKTGSGINLINETENRGLYEAKSEEETIVDFEKNENHLSQKIDIVKGDILYLFTNGFAAQLNKNGKEFGTTKLAELLNNEAQNTEENITKELNNWKSSAEQTDDICIIGIRF